MLAKIEPLHPTHMGRMGGFQSTTPSGTTSEAYVGLAFVLSFPFGKATMRMPHEGMVFLLFNTPKKALVTLMGARV